MTGHPRPVSVVAIGECTLDRYLDRAEERVGGIALNFAVHARRSGAARASLISRAGRDGAERILAALAAEGVDAQRIHVADGPNAVQEIALTPAGERVFPPGGYREGVMRGFALEAADTAFILSHDVMACALFAQSATLFEEAMADAFSPCARVADFLELGDYGGDPAVIARWHEQLALAFVSGNDAMVERLRPLSRDSRCQLVVTQGAHGSVALIRGEPHRQPAIPVTTVVDTTGCGDAFQAAFTIAHLQGADPAQALMAGARRAASVAAQLGAI